MAKPKASHPVRPVFIGPVQEGREACEFLLKYEKARKVAMLMRAELPWDDQAYKAILDEIWSLEDWIAYSRMPPTGSGPIRFLQPGEPFDVEILIDGKWNPVKLTRKAQLLVLRAISRAIQSTRRNPSLKTLEETCGTGVARVLRTMRNNAILKQVLTEVKAVGRPCRDQGGVGFKGF